MLQDKSSMVINCPACGAQLSAPREAAGRKARCKMCSHRFVILESDDLMDDTISDWIVKDIEEMYETRDLQNRQQGQARTKMTKKRQVPKPKRSKSESNGDSSNGTVMAMPVVAAPTTRPQEPLDKVPVIERDSNYLGRLTASRSDTPHLVVVRCDTAGVRFRFDGRWLEHEGFRSSMPVRCAFSGAMDRSRLIARPLVFLDRCQDRRASIEKITARHENRVLSDSCSRDLMRRMGVVARMMPPFHYAMPCYVSTKYAHLNFHTETRDRRDGGVTCDLLIPDGVCSLDWLARVNGVCGSEYEMLERDVSMLHGEAWSELSEDCRQRIAIWCKLQPREVFQIYVSDADFGRRDEGLAGIVVTDQRLIYCKYHHRGQVRLDDQQTRIVARREGEFGVLTLHSGSQRHRMVKLGGGNLDRLAQSLSRAGVFELTEDE